MSREAKGKLVIVLSLLLAMFGASLAGASLAKAQSSQPAAVAPAAPIKALAPSYQDDLQLREMLALANAPASQPAAGAPIPSLDLDAPSKLVAKFIIAAKGHSWPVAVALLISLLLWLERSTPGIASLLGRIFGNPDWGPRSTAFLTKQWVMIGTSALDAVTVAYAGASAGGWTWEAMGAAAVSGLMTGAINYGLLHSTRPVASPTPIPS